MKPFLLVALVVAVPHLSKAQDDCGCNAAEAAAPDVVATSTSANDKVLLRLNLKPGQKFSQKMEVGTRSTTVTQAQRFTVMQKMTMVLDNEVLSVSPAGDIEVRSTFGEATMSMEMFDGNGKPLPGAEEGNAANDSIFKAIKGQSLTVTFSPRARGIKMTGAKEFIDAVFRAIPTKTKADRASIEALGAGLLESIGDSKQGMMKMTAPLPEKPIGVGDSWQEEDKDTMLGYETTTTTNYTVTSLANNIAHAEVKTKIAMKDAVKAGEDKPLMATTATFAGSHDFDVATGLSRSSTLNTYSTTRVTKKKTKTSPAIDATSYTNGTMSFSTSLPTS